MRRKSIIYTVIVLAVAMFFYSTAFLCSQSPYETNQDDLKERTGQNFEDWSDNLDDLDKMKAELDRIEKESGLRYGNWNKEEIDALKEKILKERDEKEKELQEAMMAKSGKSAEELQSMREADLAVLKLRVELEKRTGKNLDKLDYWGLLEAEKFLNEKDRLRAELEAKTGQSFEGWSFDNMRKFAANLETEKEVAETVTDNQKTEVVETDKEITTEAADTQKAGEDFPVYKLTSFEILYRYEQSEEEKQENYNYRFDERPYDILLWGGGWGLDTSDLSKCEIVVNSKSVFIRGPLLSYSNMDTSEILAKSSSESKASDVEGLNKYDYLEITDSQINGRNIFGWGGGEVLYVTLWRDLSAQYDSKKISGTITCFWGQCPDPAQGVVEDLKMTVVNFSGEIFN